MWFFSAQEGEFQVENRHCVTQGGIDFIAGVAVAVLDVMSKLTPNASVVALLFSLATFGAGCAGDATEFAGDGEEATSDTSASELKESRQPTLDIVIGDNAVLDKSGSACPSRTLRLRPNVQGEALFANIAALEVEDLTTKWKKTIKTYEIPKAGILRDLDRPDAELNLDAALGDLDELEGHELVFRIIQSRRSGKVVGRSENRFLTLSSPRVDLLSAAQSADGPQQGPWRKLIFVAQMYASSPNAKGYRCDEFAFRGESASGKIMTAPILGNPVTAGQLQSLSVAGPFWIEPHAPIRATIVSGRDVNVALSKTVPIQY
ncbi:MAG: hypothetical protein U0174_13205 [Polyangiaceae bacterium]